MILAKSLFSSASRNPFIVLGLSRNCSQKEVKEAYKRLALASHPDRGGKQEDFIEISKAYKILSSNSLKSEWEAKQSKEEIWKSPRYHESDTYQSSFYQRPPTEYDLRQERYRATGEGENPPIYGPHYLIVMGILFAATLSGGVMISIMTSRRMKMVEESARQHELAELFHLKATSHAKKASEISLDDVAGSKVIK